jgi:hypothetical protein
MNRVDAVIFVEITACDSAAGQILRRQNWRDGSAVSLNERFAISRSDFVPLTGYQAQNYRRW